MSIMKEAKLAKQAKFDFTKVTAKDRNNALIEIANSLDLNWKFIEEKNKIDLQEAKKNNLSEALIDRLLLDEKRIKAMANSVREIAKQEEVVGKITKEFTREDGLKIQKQRVPIGVIGMIFESRPNVVVDCSALSIKSGNCIILKGGKEAFHSNEVLTSIIRKAIKGFIPEDVVQVVHDRNDVKELLEQVHYVDLIIPRGGEGLINYVCENSKVPVLAHYKGLCHVFIDESADSEQAKNIVLNAKTSRPGVCNALETLLIHKNFPEEKKKEILDSLKGKNTDLRLDEYLYDRYPGCNLAMDTDWDLEYLDNILSIKVVDNIEDAIHHINEHGSHHTEAILSNDDNNIDLFTRSVDASSIMVNASTRFNDGGEYGLGAELGISTSKLHAYGPMGAEEMTIERFLVTGNGHTR